MVKLTNRLRSFLLDVLRGCVIGAGFIIPGFSGGSIAALLGIYEKIVSATADVFKNFKNTVITLLPIAIGMGIGAVALLYPLGFFIERFPIPTVSLFVGLTIGGLSPLTEKVKGKIRFTNIIAFIIPLASATLLSLLPIGEDVALYGIGFGGYALLILIGILAAASIVIPGISGSMLLLIFGYYIPLKNVITENLLKFKNLGESVLILGFTCVGLALGVILISKLMKLCFTKCQRGTYIAILGFILGSIPTIFASVAKDAGYTWTSLPTSPWVWIFSTVLLAVGFLGAYIPIRYTKKRNKDV